MSTENTRFEIKLSAERRAQLNALADEAGLSSAALARLATCSCWISARCGCRCRAIHTAAAKAVGVTREWLSAALGKSHVKAWHREKRERAVLLSSGRASERIDELLDCGTT